MNIDKLLICSLFSLILLNLSSCAPSNVTNDLSVAPPEVAPKIVEETDGEEKDGDYILQAGDTIDIKFFYYPELNDLVTIRPDGKISLQLIDEVAVEGLSPSELDDVLTKKYSGRLSFPEVSVIVRQFAGLNVYVGGEVNNVGIIPIFGRLTVLQAILRAGGYKDSAELKNVVILRNQKTEEPLFMIVNLKEDLTTYAMRNDVELIPQDIVFVPKTGIAKLNQFVDEYITELIPITLNFGLMYNLNPEVKVK